MWERREGGRKQCRGKRQDICWQGRQGEALDGIVSHFPLLPSHAFPSFPFSFIPFSPFLFVFFLPRHCSPSLPIPSRPFLSFPFLTPFPSHYFPSHFILHLLFLFPPIPYPLPLSSLPFPFLLFSPPSFPHTKDGSLGIKETIANVTNDGWKPPCLSPSCPSSSCHSPTHAHLLLPSLTHWFPFPVTSLSCPSSSISCFCVIPLQVSHFPHPYPSCLVTTNSVLPSFYKLQISLTFQHVHSTASCILH